jgi:hypothetical protein
MKNLTLSKLFLDFIRPLNVLKTLFIFFNHDIKTKATFFFNIDIPYFPSIFLCVYIELRSVHFLLHFQICYEIIWAHDKSRMPKVAFSMDWAQIADLDFGLIL